MDVIIYHNPACGTSRNTLGLVRNSGIEPHVIEYLKTPPTRKMLTSLIDRMGIGVRQLLREKGTPYAELGLHEPTLSDDALIDAMLECPILINRPIVVSPKGVRLCRPSEAVLDLLPSQQDEFRKEDGELVVAGIAASVTLPLARRIAAEAVGSFFLFACVIGSGIMAEHLSAGNDAVALLGNTLATGAILFVLITMLGPVSGAHLNPAVSLVAASRLELPWPDAGAYILAQLAFGILGAWTAHLMFDLPTLQLSVKARHGLGQAMGEFIATCGLILTILGTVRFRERWVPATVALYITAAYWFTSSTSFANPAITIARSLTNTFAGIAPADVPVFIVAQLLGASVAALTARFLFDPR